MTKEQTSLLIGAVLSFLLAVLAIFGYNVVVVQPEFTEIEQTQQQILGVVMAGQGEQGIAGQNVTGFTSVNVEQDLAVGDDLTVAGDATIDTMIVEMTQTERLQIVAPTAQPTATPGLRINVLGVNEPLTIEKASTPVARVSGAGNATFAGTGTFGGAIYGPVPVLAKTSNYNVTAADSGAIIKSSGTLTLTLPGAAAGLNYCIVNYDGGDLKIEFTDNADVAINEVNSPGDSVTNTTAFDNICLAAIDTTNWATIGTSIGTWADGN
jgi:hypothetical protein